MKQKFTFLAIAFFTVASLFAVKANAQHAANYQRNNYVAYDKRNIANNRNYLGYNNTNVRRDIYYGNKKVVVIIKQDVRRDDRDRRFYIVKGKRCY
jgi:hypothetical protein